MILLLAFIAYFASKKNVKVALLGALAGVVICTVLWFTVGKKNAEGYKSSSASENVSKSIRDVRFAPSLLKSSPNRSSSGDERTDKSMGWPGRGPVFQPAPTN